MTLHKVSIKINLRIIVYGTKMQINVFARPVFGYINHALVPHAIDEVGIFHSRKLAFRAEGHLYTVLQAIAILQIAMGTRFSEIEFVAPLSIQVHPIVSYKLRTRIFRAGEHTSSKMQTTNAQT